MTWAAPITDLRQLLADEPLDKERYRKQVIGPANGVNLVFKTFENQRTENFTTAIVPNGIYVNGTRITPSTGFTSDDPESGEFILVAAPAQSAIVEATYHYMWFRDTSLTGFLVQASRALGFTDQYSNLDPGLIPSALEYAAHYAYLRLSLQWAEQYSSTYRMEDQQDPTTNAPINPYSAMAKTALSNAKTLRDDFYKRQGQPLAPNFGFVIGNVGNQVPNQ